MAQAKVTEYFSNRKKKADIQPSKRRKLQASSEVDLASQVLVSPPIPTRTRSRKLPKELIPDLNALQETPLEAKPEPTKSTRAKTSTKARKPRAKKVVKQKDVCLDIREAFLKVSTPVSSDSTTENSISAEAEDTAACDDHCGSPPCTPTKRPKADDVSVGRKRSKGAVQAKDLLDASSFQTPEKFSFAEHDPQSQKTSARKRLVLKKSSPGPDKSAVFEFKGKEIKKVLSLGSLEAEAAAVADSQNSLKDITKDDTEKKSDDVAPSSSDELESTSHDTDSGKESNISTIMENIEKLKPTEVKQKLAKCGKLDALKAKLTEVNQAKKKVEENKKQAKEIANRRLSEELIKEKEKTTERLPAHERFHYLARPVHPSLTLPISFKQLADIFYSTDIVLSMLDKRNEMCTFSKLKAAVEQMRKKAFKMRHLGQLVEVFPDAYVLRQEKGFAQFAQGRSSHYQLTIEADLSGLHTTDNKDEKSLKEKASLTSAALLQRKSIFHSQLVGIVKQHHQEFLSKLSPPLTIPDDKVTRWHPKFRLDKVPEVTPAALPEPPNSKTFKTAGEVLQHAGAMSKIGPRAAKALEMVAAKRAEEQKSNQEPKKTEADQMKGIPTSLLERIRAKEKEKDVMMMMRSPADDQRHSMLSRLPEMVRILRTFFLTEKRPALPLDAVLGKLSDSCKSSLSAKSMEDHINLLTKILPQWTQILTVKRGKFLKVDKNQDLSLIIKSLDKMILEAE